MLNSFVQGFLVSLSLIVAIGAQNALVLKQGLTRQYVFWICLLCALSDTILILAGIFGFAQILSMYPDWLIWVKYAGALFLWIYALQHFYLAYQIKSGLEQHPSQSSSLGRTLCICLMLTWLNPHVYLDTVILIGSISVQFAATKIYFASGAILASWLFFFSLGYAAQWLQPIFKDYRMWKFFHVLMALVMCWIGLHLLQ
ncbi:MULTISPECIES: LysE/ArgO family amino acid transporter [unclassified Acinetobacter]|uniref:LysE/ArgO family amino acid transporter n=1 Tax=unclassified Acinetobacter TaxID=196816 RepID=UPI0029343357|nr:MULTISPECIES: LysE/ArgO family amino acid transporter [unclassified Acinetobacter]WOE31607.1 LysE/ArgO family amino acid transporter [Acinetobacter sp. SAAs470]WOE37072.1 LysE/ArgO family amino acid transporter [Acinetobacter sp. SAAs474]